jgi:hypothetical protein
MDSLATTQEDLISNFENSCHPERSEAESKDLRLPLPLLVLNPARFLERPKPRN